MSPRKRNIVTGIVVLLALATLTWMVLTFSGGAMRIFKPKGVPVVFRCDRADGLSEGSPVFFKGVEVGRITDVRRLEDNQTVLIEGELDNHPPLPQNLQGDIRAQSSLSSSCEVDLTTQGPATGTLVSGQDIKIRYVGQSIFPPEFSDMMAEANKQQLVKHVDEMIVSLQAQVEKAGAVMDMVNSPKIRTNLETALSNISAVTEHAKILADKFDKTLAKTDKNLDQLDLDLMNLGVSFRQVQEIVTKINAGKGTGGALVNDPKLYDELALTAKELNVVAASLARLVDQWEHEGVSIKTK